MKKRAPEVGEIAEALRRHSLNIRFSPTFLAFRQTTNLGVCRVFASRYVTRCIHGAAVYLCFDKYKSWNDSNLLRQDEEVTERWTYLSNPIALSIMHVLGVMLLRMYLPFMSMASKPQRVREYRDYVLQSLSWCETMMKYKNRRHSFFGHRHDGLIWPGIALDQNSELRAYIPEIANVGAVKLIKDSWDKICKTVDALETIVLTSYTAALQKYDGELVDQDADLPLSSVFRPSNRLGEGVFATADNWLRNANSPNFGGANVEAFCKIKQKPMDYLVDWAGRHPDLLPYLAAWGREWQDEYPARRTTPNRCSLPHRRRRILIFPNASWIAYDTPLRSSQNLIN